jgi:hypothetical protein
VTRRTEREARDRSETGGRSTNNSTSTASRDGSRISDGPEFKRRGARTVEILRMCSSGGWVRLVRHASANSAELVLEITEESVDGRRFERRLTLEKD